MAYSTELREPLDHRLVEYAFVQPYEYKINNGIQNIFCANWSLNT